MSNDITELQRRLLDGESPERLRMELASDSLGEGPVREAIESADLIGALDAERGRADGLRPGALNRVWINLDKVIVAKALSQSRDVATSAEAPSVAERLRRAFEIPRRFIYKGALLAALIALGALYLGRDKPVGRLAFMGDQAVIVERGSTQSRFGFEGKKLSIGDLLQTRAGGAIVYCSAEAEALLAPQSALRLEGERLAYLDAGKAWFEIAKGGGDFIVQTAQARVLVTGTAFGVSLVDGLTLVTLKEGSVKVSDLDGDCSIDLTEGQSVEVSEDTDDADDLESQTASTELPEWVVDLREQALAASVAEFVPSVTGAAENP